MKTKQLFYIKERDNPQTGTYYVACGQMSKAAARHAEYALYGSNTMLSFETEGAYMAKLASLKRQGKNVH